METKNAHSYIGVINASSQFVKFSLIDPINENEACCHQIDIRTMSPQDGWAEQDPEELLSATYECINETVNVFQRTHSLSQICAVGIANQRETTIVWDSTNGRPLYNAILWHDNRTSSVVDKIMLKFPDKDKDYLKSYCGLPLSTYFSALKLRWLMDNVPSINWAIRSKRCLFGTVDSWLVWHLTGGATDCGVHVTDVTNASRTMLMNIKTLKWDPLLCRYFDVPMDILPTIKSSSEIYGYVKQSTALNGIPISGILGNQQAGLVGERCTSKGHVRGNYKTGCFLLYNSGYTCTFSSHGLITTVAYQLGKDEPPVYALEGSVAVAGLGLEWLSSNLKLAGNLKEAFQTAASVSSCGDIYFVPAFYGLLAPYWRKDARGIICGLTQFTNKAHILRAGIEAVCFQTKDVLQAMRNDCEFPVINIRAGGKFADSDLFTQLLADITGIEIVRNSSQKDVTAIGVAIVASQAKGIKMCNTEYAAPSDLSINKFYPSISDSERHLRYKKWKMAIQRSIGWEYNKQPNANITVSRYKMLASVPLVMYITSSFGLLAFSEYRL